MKTKKIMALWILSATMMTLCPLSVLAVPGPNAKEAVAVDPYDEETMARLRDGRLEYDEIEKRINLYNTTVSTIRNTLKDNIKKYEIAAESLTSAKKTMQRYRDEVKDDNKNSMGMEAIIEMKTYDGLAGGLRTFSGIMRRIANTIEDDSDESLEQARTPLTFATNQVVMGYAQIVANKATLHQLKVLNQSIYDATVNQANAGMATQTAVLSAKKEVLSAESAILSLEAQEKQLYRTICTLTGYTVAENPEIASLPSADLTKLVSYDLANDTVKAIGNNQTLIKQRHAKESRSTSYQSNRLHNIEVGEEKLTVEMQRIHRDIQDKKLAYEAAQTGMENARLAKESANRKYQIGMLGRAQYEGLELQYIQQQATFANADIALFQAMEMYEWAVRGYLADEAWNS